MHYALRPLIIYALVATLLPALLVYHRASLKAGYDTVLSSISSKTGGAASPSSQTAPSLAPPPDDYLAVCVAVKDQRHDLPEWLHHHYYNMGVGRFYLMDDGSKPPLSDLPDDFLTIPRTAVEFHYFKPEAHVQYMQFKLYNECANLAKNRNITWMAFIDADEFLDAPGPQTLREILEDYGRIKVIGAVGINWRIHTSGGHLKRPLSVLEAFTECIYDDAEHNGANTDNKHIKSIVRLSNYDHPHNPHRFILRGGAITVGEHGDQLMSPFRQPITRDRLAVHHYAMKSKEEYEEKMNRGSAMSHHKGWDWWDHVEKKLPHEACPEMLRWANKP